VPQKDFTTLLDAVAQAGRSTRLQLVILGEGPERSRLEDHAVSLGIAERVQFPGFLANPYPVLARARVFVSSSRFEGFGIAIVEAMTLRVPVVATDCRSGPAEILGHGSFGRLVPVGDSAALAAAIGAALADPGPVAEAARSATEYDVARVADRYLALLGTAPAEPE
jgi:glycosyltransferase involved in cell wall biosynthesis